MRRDKAKQLHTLKQCHLLNIIIISGKEINRDFPSNSNQSGNSSSMKSPANDAGDLWPRVAGWSWLPIQKLPGKVCQRG